MIFQLFVCVTSLIIFMLDMAIFFLAVRILTNFLRLRPLLFLDRVGVVGVDSIMTVMTRCFQRWSHRQRSRLQEETLTLLIFSIASWIFSALLALA